MAKEFTTTIQGEKIHFELSNSSESSNSWIASKFVDCPSFTGWEFIGVIYTSYECIGKGDVIDEFMNEYDFS